jgi:prephenate dehydratase
MLDPKGLAAEITTIHTLGPSGTNCERAAEEWFNRGGIKGKIRLYPSLEVAAEAAMEDPHGGLLGCVVYPDLHTLVFSSLDRLELVDCFVMPTYNMVLAARADATRPLECVATHPAPQHLVPKAVRERRFVDSNAQAAIDCARGLTDGCITTSFAAEEHSLVLLEDFGAVPMGFTIHVPSKKAVTAGGAT